MTVTSPWNQCQRILDRDGVGALKAQKKFEKVFLKNPRFKDETDSSAHKERLEGFTQDVPQGGTHSGGSSCAV